MFYMYALPDVTDNLIMFQDPWKNRDIDNGELYTIWYILSQFD